MEYKDLKPDCFYWVIQNGELNIVSSEKGEDWGSKELVFFICGNWEGCFLFADFKKFICEIKKPNLF